MAGGCWLGWRRGGGALRDREGYSLSPSNHSKSNLFRDKSAIQLDK